MRAAGQERGAGRVLACALESWIALDAVLYVALCLADEHYC